MRRVQRGLDGCLAAGFGDGRVAGDHRPGSRHRVPHPHHRDDGDRIYLTWQAIDPTDTKLGTGFVWADRIWSEGMRVWFGSASPGGLTVTYAELDDTSFRFKKKNNEHDGIPADHAGHTVYVKLSWEDMMDPEYDGGGYPRTDDQLAAETDPVTNVIKIGESACLFSDLAALWAFRYPASVAELLPE